MDITVSFFLIRFIIGAVICVVFGFLQFRFRHFNFIYILLCLFVMSSIVCLFIANEILYMVITFNFIAVTAVVGLIRFILFIQSYREEQQSKKHKVG